VRVLVRLFTPCPKVGQKSLRHSLAAARSSARKMAVRCRLIGYSFGWSFGGLCSTGILSFSEKVEMRANGLSGLQKARANVALFPSRRSAGRGRGRTVPISSDDPPRRPLLVSGFPVVLICHACQTPRLLRAFTLYTCSLDKRRRAGAEYMLVRLNGSRVVAVVNRVLFEEC